MKRNLMLILFFFSFAILIFQCAKQVSTEADIEAIKNIGNLIVKAFNEGNLDDLMKLYTDNAIVMPPNQPAAIGKEAVRSYYQFVEENSYSIEYPSDEIKVAGDFAFRRGTFKGTLTLEESGETVSINNKGMLLLQKQTDGSWKISHAVFNSNTPIENTNY